MPRLYNRWSFLLLASYLTIALALFVLGIWHDSSARSIALYRAWPAAVEWLTHRRFTIQTPEAVAAGALLLILIRKVRLDWLVIRPGPVEVRPIEDASGRFLSAAKQPSGNGDSRAIDVFLARLNVEFREALSASQLYETTTIPGDLETERIIEVYGGGQAGGRLAMLGAAWTFFWPKRAFVVTATLRTRYPEPRYGVSVSVRRIPQSGVELETHWSDDFERALQRAAFAVTAHILPQTRACARPPWGQWRRQAGGKPMPMELMRHYQRAKRMVGERRYDEALSLYHSALLYDADNVHLRYDIGQLFERLQLHPDAVRHYALLTNQLFPVVEPARRGRGVRRKRKRGSRSLHDDPFMVRYRYVVGLSTGSRLARELLTPDWPALRYWLKVDAEGESYPATKAEAALRSYRPLRATELVDLRRELVLIFDRVWTDTLPATAALYQKGLAAVLIEGPHAAKQAISRKRAGSPKSWKDLNSDEDRCAAVEEYFLHVAERENRLLIEAFTRFRRWPRISRVNSSLTKPVLRVQGLLIEYRQRALYGRVGSKPDPEPAKIEEMREDLLKTGYQDDSSRWLEHYIAACFYALPLQDDEHQIKEHVPYAEAAVRALDRAQECGDDAEFVTSKRYWLLAGDPDLSGLRVYESFRAFEARVYRHPQPTTNNPAKYELFHYMRLGVAQGAQSMEHLWLQRLSTRAADLPASELESWFRVERRAWEMFVRLGRFYRQWQTRSAGLESLRRLGRYTGAESAPVPYPEVVRDFYNAGIGGAEQTRRRLRGMEDLFEFLAHELGPAAAIDVEEAVPALPAAMTEAETPDEAQPGDPAKSRHTSKKTKQSFKASVIANTRAWIWHAEHCTRAVPGAEYPLSEAQFAELCTARAAVWAALRQRATTPARRADHAFIEAVKRLPKVETPGDGRRPSERWRRPRGR